MTKSGLVRLGVNIDHIATLRQARLTPYPDIVHFVKIAQKAGACQITLHLREDRRHIQDQDLPKIRKIAKCMNLEMALKKEIERIAIKIKPDWVCLVPEKRKELTTEGGLDVGKNIKKIARSIQRFKQKKIKTSLFINPNQQQLAAAIAVKADAVEFHTGHFANLFLANKKNACQKELSKIQRCATLAASHGLSVHAGHGLTLANVKYILKIKEISELNIGHAIVCDALEYGWKKAIELMDTKIKKYK